MSCFIPDAPPDDVGVLRGKSKSIAGQLLLLDLVEANVPPQPVRDILKMIRNAKAKGVDQG